MERRSQRRLAIAMIFAAALLSGPSASAQTARRVSVFGGLGASFGDPGTSSGSLSYGGSLFVPLRTLMRMSADAHTFAFGGGNPPSRQTLVGAALAAEGPSGRRVRLFAAAGAGAVWYYEPHREGTVPVAYGELGTIITATRHLLIRADSIFWAGDATAVFAVRGGVGYRF